MTEYGPGSCGRYASALNTPRGTLRDDSGTGTTQQQRRRRRRHRWIQSQQRLRGGGSRGSDVGRGHGDATAAVDATGDGGEVEGQWSEVEGLRERGRDGGDGSQGEACLSSIQLSVMLA